MEETDTSDDEGVQCMDHVVQSCLTVLQHTGQSHTFNLIQKEILPLTLTQKIILLLTSPLSWSYSPKVHKADQERHIGTNGNLVMMLRTSKRLKFKHELVQIYKLLFPAYNTEQQAETEKNNLI